MNRLIFFLLVIPVLSYGQNVGVGTENPTEKLEVNGIIFTSQGGIKFPDGTIQTTAYQSGTSMMQSGLSALVIEFSSDAMIAGPATDALIQDGVNILSVSDGLTSQVTTPFFSEVSFNRVSDEHSSKIFSLLTNNTNVGHIEVFFLRLNGQGDAYYVEQIHRYENCEIQSLSTSSGGGQPLEAISFNFTKVCYRSYVFDPDTGEPTSTPNDFCWDLMSNMSNCSCNY